MGDTPIKTDLAGRLTFQEGLTPWINWVLQRSSKEKLTAFMKWMEQERNNRKFLERVSIKGAAVYATNGFGHIDTTSMEDHFDAVFSKKHDQDPVKVAKAYERIHKISPTLRRFVIAVAVKTKRRVGGRLAKQAKTRGKRTGKPVCSIILTEDTLPVTVEIDEGARRKPVVIPPCGPEIWELAAEHRVVLDHKARPEDYERALGPYRTQIGKDGYTGVVDSLLSLLYDNVGCPSITDSIDLENEGLKNYPDKRIREVFQKVSLYDHTFRVLERAVQAIEDDGKGNLAWFATAIVTAALGHDIGRISSIAKEAPDRSGDHTEIGATKLRVLGEGLNQEILKTITAAIRYHHENTKPDSTARIIMEADTKVRLTEIREAYPNYTVDKPMSEWLDLEQFARNAAPAINRLTGGSHRWNALSHNGIVYCTPEFVKSLLRQLAVEANVIDWRLIRNIRRFDDYGVLRDLAALLRARGVLAWDIKDPYFGLDFVIKSRNVRFREKTAYCIPISIQFFPGTVAAIESRKEDYLALVHRVAPAKRKFSR